MNFRIGQQIVCIPAPTGRKYFLYNRTLVLDRAPVVGQVYTVRGFDSSPHDVGLLLEEIVSTNPRYSWGGEIGFSHSRFRPVVKQTDISVFQKMLLPKKSKVKA